jgi:hypothetical protein
MEAPPPIKNRRNHPVDRGHRSKLYHRKRRTTGRAAVEIRIRRTGRLSTVLV